MSAIDDNALILHYYNDDESPQRRALVEHALAVSPELRLRYERLRRVLAAASDVAPATPDAGFEQRLWQSLESRMAADAAMPTASVAPLPFARTASRAQQRPRSRWRVATAAAASVVLILGAGFFAGRVSVPEAPPQVASQAEPLLATRVLDAYVAAHLRETEGVLLTALNSDSTDLGDGNAELAAALVESNRLYTTAAARSGNLRLADFLRQMEPVLIELANPPRGDGVEVRDGLRAYVRESDLLFQVRATEGALESRGNRRT